MPSTKPRILLIGAPGSGKTSTAEKLAAKLGVPHVDGSSVLKKTIIAGSSKPAPQEVFNAIINCDHKGVVVSGFPKTVAQAVMLDRLLSSANLNFDRVVMFDLPERLQKRRMKTRKRAGENDKKRHTKILGFRKQKALLRAFYRDKGVLIEMQPRAKQRFVARRVLRVAKGMQKAKELRARHLEGRK